MSYFIRVLCELDVSVTRRELAQFITEGAYFSDPIFSPPAESSETLQSVWKTFVITYHHDKRPILFQRLDGVSAFAEAVEITGKVSKVRTDECFSLILTKLQKVKQVFVIEIDPVGLPEGAWLMLDCCESFLSRSCGGVIYAPDDGFYDADLHRIL